jgi:hypothetical protein
MTAEHAPMERMELDTGQLVARYPPAWRHPNKRVVLEIACAPGDVHGGRLAYSRWAAMPLPDSVELRAIGDVLAGRDGFFDYETMLDPAASGMEWHVNFADPDLFVAYDSMLFAQDEMQVAEHPALGSLREMLTAQHRDALTVEDSRPTPILVAGVERRCRVATDASAEAGRPHGLYGNLFARASREAVARATTRVEPPTITNLIAMAARPGGEGAYTSDDIETTLMTAFTGFRAAALETRRQRGDRAEVVVHTGYWGCGAFGGNRTLMAILQLLAARMAGLRRLAFHVGPAGGRQPLADALRLVREELGPVPSAPVRTLVARLEAMGFEWGVSDGN